MTTNRALVADLLAHAQAQQAAQPTARDSWQAVVDRLDSLRSAVRQAERNGKPVPALDAVALAVHSKVGRADTAVTELDAVLRVLEQ